MAISMNLEDYMKGINLIRADLGIATSLSNYPGLQQIRYTADNTTPYEVIISPTSAGDYPLSVILRKSDLYIQGFVNRTNTYCYFEDSSITALPGKVSQSLRINGSYVSGLTGQDNTVISAASLDNSIKYSYNFTEGKVDTNALTVLVFQIGEATRFKHVSTAVTNILAYTQPQVTWGSFKTDLNAWSNYSRIALANTKNDDIASKLMVAKP